MLTACTLYKSTTIDSEHSVNYKCNELDLLTCEINGQLFNKYNYLIKTIIQLLQLFNKYIDLTNTII